MILKEMLPELQSFHNIKGNKPKIRFYEGKEGLREVYEDTLTGSKQIYSFASDDIVGVLGKDWANYYLEKRIKKIFICVQFYQQQILLRNIMQ
jgi:hypothetical protein